jgi:hypothetical protein
MKTIQFDEYIKKLLKASVNVFSGVSFIILIIAYLFPIDLSAKTQITGLAAVLCIICAGYKVWKEAAEKIPSGTTFKIIKKTPLFHPHAFLGDGRLDSRASFIIDFDFINSLAQIIVLQCPKISLLKIDGDLISNNPISIYFKLLPNTIGLIDFPYNIGKESRSSIRCEINVPFIVTDRLEFAEKLRNIKEYEIEFQFLYEDMTASTKTENIKVNGNFDDFKHEVLNFWKKKNYFDLICKATGNA